MPEKLMALFIGLCTFVIFFAPSAARAAPAIPFGFCPKYNPRIMYEYYQPFIDYLNQHTAFQFELKLSRVYPETIARLGKKEILIASCGPVSYVQARKKYPVRPLLRPLSRDGKPHYRGVIIVRKDSPIRKLENLKGKSFAFGQEWSTCGHILPEYYLGKAGIGLKNLKRYAFLRHHDSVVSSVLKGEYDAGAVKDVIALQHHAEGLRFIHLSEFIPTVPIIVHEKAPWEMVMSVKNALLKIKPQDPVYKQKIMSWDEEFKYGFTEADDADYDVIRKIIRNISPDRGRKGDIGN